MQSGLLLEVWQICCNNCYQFDSICLYVNHLFLSCHAHGAVNASELSAEVKSRLCRAEQLLLLQARPSSAGSLSQNNRSSINDAVKMPKSLC